MKAYVFPGQGSQFTGMGRDLFERTAEARAYFGQANAIVGFDLTQIMFAGTDEELKQTRVTQPAIFLHSVALALTLDDFTPGRSEVAMVAGHSLGEFSALVGAGALRFEDGLRLVAQRADAMQRACERQPSTMAAILGLDDAVIEQVCADITNAAQPGNVVVPANYNCPGQVVISGSTAAVEQACEALKAAGAKRAILLPVSGAFHSPLMEPAREELAQAIDATTFQPPRCPIYQNVDARPTTDVATIKANLIAQLTAPVRWTQSVQAMAADGATQFVECGPGKVLQGLVRKILSTAETTGVQ